MNGKKFKRDFTLGIKFIHLIQYGWLFTKKFKILCDNQLHGSLLAHFF